MRKSLARNPKTTAGTPDFQSRCLLFSAILLVFFWASPGLFYGHPDAGGPHETNRKRGTLEAEEKNVNVGLVFNFGRFTRWPKESFKDEKSPLEICVLSETSDVAETFKSAMRQKTIEGRKVLVRSVLQNEEIKGCHILYLDTDNREIILEKLKFANNKNILTVGKTDDFAKMCGIITLSIKKDTGKKETIRFHINEQAGKRAGLKFKAGMLKAADELFDKGCGQ